MLPDRLRRQYLERRQQHVPESSKSGESLWIDAAREFTMNTDFDILDVLSPTQLGLSELMEVMKRESAGKETIRRLNDKIQLVDIVDQLGVPQMPVLYSTRQPADTAALTAAFDEIQDADFDIIVKPTHLSNATGALAFNGPEWRARKFEAWMVAEHMDKFMNQRAEDCESEALKSVAAGYVIQPRYRSVVEFKWPLELRVVTLWGKARLAVWWWGRELGPKNTTPHRTTFFVRCTEGSFSSQDTWQVISRHPGGNRGYAEALRLFTEGLPAMALMSEAVATGVGAPFLRSDFFVGSQEHGIRLNEVAYGSSAHLMDCGADEMAAILQQGYSVCKRVGSEVLARQLATGSGMPAELSTALAVACAGQLSPVPAEECATPRPAPAPTPQRTVVASATKVEVLGAPRVAPVGILPSPSKQPGMTGGAVMMPTAARGNFPHVGASAIQSVLLQRVGVAAPPHMSAAPQVRPAVSFGYRR
mmetsp:Transcript_41098/g.93861  ORF Transcript_41098/g.93861 Transcript_41098/m.93861 type:complete len:476 (+) Transcript_41098:18-1445(+)|eukprot:CAMPEP_0204369494 /NCGR_PEP_ID=MMETSP0469-20131031/45009_1 /ASSEMBLY_ACC=CAM_ASM_000384 /TAXON_ID=2969 /ORGANISM="Oxyrrhis marina" /LENGTH=475 /DNA_ID=CAMNT_0051359245 /DNA_START=1 /DNA_END=1428 /DNA_ORIENTATION=+